MKTPHCIVLLVEDDPNDQLLFQAALKSLGSHAEIHMVNDGAEALAYLAGKGKYADRSRFRFPTMLITDLKMPMHDGFQLLSTICSHREWSIIPLIVLSGSTDADDIRKAYAAGANTYFVKPANPRELRELIGYMHYYWSHAEVPQVDETGCPLPTCSAGKLGERVRV